jgi:hypothetical protein
MKCIAYRSPCATTLAFLALSLATAKEAGYPQLERVSGWSALYGAGRHDAFRGSAVPYVQRSGQEAGYTDQVDRIAARAPSRSKYRRVVQGPIQI